MKLLGNIVIVFFTLSSYGQVILLNTMDVDTSRYADIEGTPYYFKEHSKAELYLPTDSKEYRVTLNINLYEKKVEVFKNNEFIEYEYSEISRIKMNSPVGIDIFPLNDKLLFILYKNGVTTLVNTPVVKIETRTIRTPKSSTNKKVFFKKDQYVLANENGNHNISFDKKSIKNALGQGALKVAKDHKLDLSTEAGLIKLLNIYHE